MFGTYSLVDEAEVHVMTAMPLPSARRIVGQSDWAQSISSSIERVAQHDSTILITGPSGTGKELIARAIHAHSPRANQPFIPVDCAVATGSLWSSQLFGHVKGAFTGASYQSLGCFRAADGGTIFFDEIGELDQHLQAQLLRVLQERTVVPVGTHRDYPVDIRVIAATNRDLSSRVKTESFRYDLYYRLKVISLNTLPLTERIDDIPVLARYFLAMIAVKLGLPQKRLSRGALEKLRQYSWPGNVRELQNVLENAVVFAEDEVIDADLLLFEDGNASAAGVAPSAPSPAAIESKVDQTVARTPSNENLRQRWETLAEHEAAYIQQTLERTHYNQTEAARLLGINRHLLGRKLKKYGLR